MHNAISTDVLLISHSFLSPTSVMIMLFPLLYFLSLASLRLVSKPT